MKVLVVMWIEVVGRCMVCLKTMPSLKVCIFGEAKRKIFWKFDGYYVEYERFRRIGRYEKFSS